MQVPTLSEFLKLCFTSGKFVLGSSANRKQFGTLTFHAGYATSRFSPNLNGSTKRFGWLQALTTSRIGSLGFTCHAASKLSFKPTALATA
jgi:hypothetical protein